MFGTPFAALLKIKYLEKKCVRQIAIKYMYRILHFDSYSIKSAEYLKHKRVVPLDLVHVYMRPCYINDLI